MGPTISFKGIENGVYYLLEDNKRLYKNFSGTGNTVRANHAVARKLIRDCLEYWVSEMHIDGFRFDLASVRQAEIQASNDGVVVLASYFGIYGNCVVIDHGLGVATLYGHLSRLDVTAGQRVERGARLGLSGATGLAGGDHLHFAVLVGGTYVDPLEWWDPKWFASNVEDRLVSAGQ